MIKTDKKIRFGVQLTPYLKDLQFNSDNGKLATTEEEKRLCEEYFLFSKVGELLQKTIHMVN